MIPSVTGKEIRVSELPEGSFGIRHVLLEKREEPKGIVGIVDIEIEGETLEQIGRSYNLSRERVRQIQVQGLRKMQRFCESRRLAI